ncbi:prepilin-type N-terminal cleavage/methylation domain-containing protein [Pelagicoccus enzymogenes]|uniref:PulJ/GspJ family protein n=1 Tax=Pelagicoccus enzymogenes TaxID=2773457 RepID=UPI00280D22BA|nr:prepilin-type N-terminal cleavage/methylation domain-containing protein [Pelagicoccus enzymogenes]MDQ8199337.1 prepilin-type N-terminal cleavage/methylation domain-containing protein [Pelagicoccus enzymogenes]
MKRSLDSKGFTLLELIVSIAITAVIALFVLQFATSLAQIWRTTESGVGTELDAHIALDVIARDLESAVFQERMLASEEGGGEPTPQPMFAATALVDASNSSRWVGGSVSKRPTAWHFSPDQHRYGWAGTWLRFFSAAPSFNAVGYQIIRRTPFGDSTEPRYLLHRTVIRQDNTMAGGFDITANGFRDGNTDYGLLNPRLDGVLLEDVVDFGVRLYVLDPDANATDDTPEGLTLIFPADSNGNLSATDTEHLAWTHSGESHDRQYPDLIEIFLRVLDDVGSSKLLELEEGTLDDTYENIVEQHGRLYRRMVRMPGRE